MVAAIATAISCIKEKDITTTSEPSIELAPMTFSGTLEDSHDETTKTTYQNRSIFWEENDAISVFFNNTDNTQTKQTFTATERYEDNATAKFEGLGVESSESYIAVYPDLPSNKYDGTNISVTIPSVQTGILNSFESGANVSIACSQDENLLFRNVGSLIGFRFATQSEASKIASITFRAKSKTGAGFLGLSGASNVTLDENHIPVAGSGSVDHVTINAPEGGFIGGTGDTYFAAVYPFDCSGIEVTMTYTDNQSTILNNDSPATVARNTGLSLGKLSTALKLPDEFEVKLDFAKGWPFKESILGSTKQMSSGSGDIYTLEYSFVAGDKTHTTDLLFYLFGGAVSGAHQPYAYHTGSAPYQLRTSGDNARILLPGIEGRHLKCVKVEVNNAAPNYKRTQIVGTDWQLKVEGPKAINTEPSIINIPNGYFWSDVNTSYYLRFPTKNLQVTAITLTYTKTLEANASSEDIKPSGHFTLMQVTNAGTTQMMSYIMKTDEGKVIVIDGGNAGGDATKLRGILQEKYGNKVHMWWISHPHSDHIGALNDILDDKQGLTIEYLLHSKFSEAHLSRERSQGEIARAFYKKIEGDSSIKVFGDIPAGASYNVDGVLISVLGVTNEEITTNAYNNSSMILRFEDKDKSVVFLGDAGEECGDKVLKKYSNQLDCDYLQMAHHGQKGVREEFYKTISFRACLWPTPKWLWDAVDGNANDWKTWQTRQWMDEKGITEHHVMWEDVDWYLE